MAVNGPQLCLATTRTYLDPRRHLGALQERVAADHDRLVVAVCALIHPRPGPGLGPPALQPPAGRGGGAIGGNFPSGGSGRGRGRRHRLGDPGGVEDGELGRGVEG